MSNFFKNRSLYDLFGEFLLKKPITKLARLNAVLLIPVQKYWSSFSSMT